MISHTDSFSSLTHICPMLLFFQAKVPCLPRFWSVMNIFDTSFESDLENCDLEDQISASHKWDSGHERVVLLLLFFRLCDREDCSELLLKQNTFL